MAPVRKTDDRLRRRPGPRHGWLAATAAVLLAPATWAADVRVADFGARPDDGKDDTAAIRSAIEACRDKKGPRLVFAKGRYDLATPGKARARTYLPLKALTDLTIDGGGAELVGHDLAAMFHFDKCRNVTIRNLTIDWSPLPFTGGQVIATGAKHFDLKVSPPHRAAADLGAEGVLGYDPKARRLARRGIDLYQMGFAKRTELVRPGVMRVFVRARPPAAGSHVVVRHRIYGYNAFTFINCAKVRLDGVNVYAAPGMGLYAHSSRDFTLARFNVMIRPGSGRWMSATADATHFNTCRGTITIEDCIFEGMGDDATNVHSMFLVVAERVDDRTLTLAVGRNPRHTPPEPARGDRLELGGGPNPLVPYATVTVGSARVEGKALLVKLAAPLPKRTAKGDVVGNASACARTRIRRCIVRNNRARGMLIQTRDAVIENCRFEYCSGAALHIACDANYWWEAIGTRDVLVRKNVFVGCNFGIGRRGGTIDVFAEVGRKIAPAGVHRRITIADNVIRDADGAAVHVNSADGVVVKGNTIERPTGVAIFVDHSRNVQIEGNRLVGGAGGLKIGPNCDRPTIRAAGNTGF